MRKTPHVGHHIAAVIATEESVRALATSLQTKHVVPLKHGFAMMPVTYSLLQALDPAESVPDRDPLCFVFTCLTQPLLDRIKALSAGRAYTFLQTDYHGGIGSQWAVVFKDGTAFQPGNPASPSAPRAISECLRFIGVRVTGQHDEFDELGLSEHRSMQRWELDDA